MNTLITQPLNVLAAIRRQHETFKKSFLQSVELRHCAECGTRTNHHLIDGRWRCIVCVNMEQSWRAREVGGQV